MKDAEAGLAKLADAAPGPATIEVGIALRSIIASVHFANNELEEALKVLHKGHQLRVQGLGPGHTQLVPSLLNIGTTEYKLGRLDDAAKTLEQATKLLGSPNANDSDKARSTHLAALVQGQLGNNERALALHEETLLLRIKIFGEDHRLVWQTRNNLANILVGMERWDDAKKTQREFLTWARRRPEGDPQVLNALINLANTLSQQEPKPDEDLQEALALTKEAMERLPASDPRTTNVLSVRAAALYASGHFAESAATYGKAFEAGEQAAHSKASLQAYILSRQAEGLWKANKRALAITTAKRSLALYKDIPHRAEAMAELQGWIAARSEL